MRERGYLNFGRNLSQRILTDCNFQSLQKTFLCRHMVELSQFHSQVYLIRATERKQHVILNQNVFCIQENDDIEIYNVQMRLTRTQHANTKPQLGRILKTKQFLLHYQRNLLYVKLIIPSSFYWTNTQPIQRVSF